MTMVTVGGNVVSAAVIDGNKAAAHKDNVAA
jgi:hypothetical protein